ncbi:MAG: amidophosphoribosyltransferase [Candidatus Omnitrophica bacterium]|nr:amidophosphoribosyltransferase [Candidatus Omnitrophota bacterium]
MEIIRENCGLAGVFRNKRAAEILHACLFSLQHRGQEAAGIILGKDDSFSFHGNRGLVSEIFTSQVIKSMEGDYGIGHVRYSTTGSNSSRNIQPFFIDYKGQTIAVAHNGNITNSRILRSKLENQGAIFQTTMDSEIILHLLVRSRGRDIREKLAGTLKQLKGAFSILVFVQDKIIAARDSCGFRPLSIGKLSDSFIVASETCAFDLIGAEYVRDVEPGEMVIFSDSGIDSYKWTENIKKSHCIFEFIYFARPDSCIFGKSVYLTRKRLGENLAIECDFTADLVMPVPDSGSIAAIGFSQKKQIPLEFGVIRNHYIGRTFIQPSQKMRDSGTRIKLNPVKSIIQDRDIIVIEDSIVRGTTCRNRIRALKDAGAKRIMLGISCPPIKFPCYFGIDFPSKEELIANKMSVEEIRRFLGLDGLYYLSLKGMLDAMMLPAEDFCTACFTGRYPIRPDFSFNKSQWERKDGCDS